MRYLDGHPIPSNIQEYVELYGIYEWGHFCAYLLLSIRMGFTHPNEFHNFCLGIYLWEYDRKMCKECGLNEGPWCQPCKFLDYHFTILTNLSF